MILSMGANVYTVGPFSLDDKLLHKIDAPDYSVKFPEESGGGYMAILESIHQLHCVVSIVINLTCMLDVLLIILRHQLERSLAECLP